MRKRLIYGIIAYLALVGIGRSQVFNNAVNAPGQNFEAVIIARFLAGADTLTDYFVGDRYIGNAELVRTPELSNFWLPDSVVEADTIRFWRKTSNFAIVNGQPVGIDTTVYINVGRGANRSEQFWKFKVINGELVRQVPPGTVRFPFEDVFQPPDDDKLKRPRKRDLPNRKRGESIIRPGR